MPNDQSMDSGWQPMPNDQPMDNGANDLNAVALAVRELLDGVRQGEPLHAGGFTLIPLLPATDRVARQTGYLPLEEALKREAIAITEQPSATVPELLATSTADAPVVLVGGEQVIGGLQNRVLNTTILVAARSTLPIPVTCVEAGRWHESSSMYSASSGGDSSGASARAAKERAFASDEAAYASLRKMHAKAVTSSLSEGRGHGSDQGAVWGEVGQRMAFSGASSPSRAMYAMYKAPDRAARLQETIDKLPCPEHALGFIAVLGAEVLGAELFADEALADAYWTKLARSYAFEALDLPEPGDARRADEDAGTPAAELLREALAADIQIHPSPGLGADARLVGTHVTGAGLVNGDVVVHLSLFPDAPDDSDPSASETAQRRQSFQRARVRQQPTIE